MPRPFPFSLQWPFVLLVGMIAGGKAAYNIACVKSEMNGGALISFSASGKVLVVVVGAMAALAGMIILAYAPWWLRHRVPWRVRNKLLQTAILIAMAPLIGGTSAALAMLALMPVLFTMPKAIFDFITTNP